MYKIFLYENDIIKFITSPTDNNYIIIHTSQKPVKFYIDNYLK